MVDTNKLLPLVRTIIFGGVTLLTVIVFCLSAHLIALTSSFQPGAYFTFAALSLATAILTLLTLPAMYFISLKRRGAHTSYVAVEIAWLWFLWIMWIASGGSTAAVVGFCGLSACAEAQVIAAFGFLNWIALMGYTTTLLVLAIMAHSRGHSHVWTSEVGQFDWSAPSVKNQNVGGVVGVAVPAGTYQDKTYNGNSVSGHQVEQQQYPPMPASPQSTGTANYVGAPNGAVPYAPQV